MQDRTCAANWILAAALAIFLTVPALGQQTAQPGASNAGKNSASTTGDASTPPDKVVLTVGSQKVTAGEFNQMIKNLPAQTQQALAVQGPRALGDRYATILALSQKAESEHLDRSAEFQKRMAIERAQSLAQAEYEKLASQVKVSPGDVNQYYSAHPSEFDQVELRQISVQKRASDAKPGAPGLASQDAHTRADAIRKALSSGTDAQKVADQFKGSGDVVIDLQPRAVRRAQMPAALQNKVFDLKDGEVSEPIENAQAIYLVQVVRHEKVDLKAASTEIENKLQNERLEALVSDIKTKAGVRMDPGYFSAGHPAAGSPTEEAPRQPNGPQSLK